MKFFQIIIGVVIKMWSPACDVIDLSVPQEKKMRYTPEETGFKSKTFQLRLSLETYEKLEELAKKKGMKKSQYIQYLIENQK